MTDRDLDDRDWMEDEATWATEEDAAWEEAESRSEEDLEWAVSRCATEGCEAEGTEKLGDEFVCPACYQAAFQREYDRERGMGR